MRLLVTTDLHYNHARSRPVAEEVIGRMNAAGGDVLLLVGDTSIADGDSLEQCLSLFQFSGPKLFVAGNHELWTHGPDSYALFTTELPARVRAAGWRWLEGDPFISGHAAIVGSIGWYDYSFAQPGLGIPKRFYQHKISPGAAERLEEHAHLLEQRDDIAPVGASVVARWNDGQFVKLHRSDEAFLAERLADLRRQLQSLRDVPHVVAAIHHLPFRDLLPPPRNSQWDFTKAYLGSEAIGDLLLEFPNVRQVFCGHSHFPARARVGHIDAVNIGCGYGWKSFQQVELPDQ